MNDTVAESVDAPMPPRFRWMRRIVFLALLGLIMVLALRVWWGWEADRRAASASERYRAVGEPVSFSELQPPIKNPQENAAYWLMLAANSLVGGNVSIDDAQGDPRMWRDRFDDVRDLVTDNFAASEFVRIARGCDRAQWDFPLHQTPSNWGATWQVQSGQRQLAKLSDVAATVYYRTGDHTEAVEQIRDLLHIEQALGSHSDVLTQAMSMAMGRLVYWRVERIGESLVSGRGTDGERVERPAPREQIAALIAELRGEEREIDNMVNAFHGERLSQQDLAEQAETIQLALGAAPGGAPLSLAGSVAELVVWGCRPRWTLECIPGMESWSVLASAARRSNWIEATDHLGVPEPIDVAKPTRSSAALRRHARSYILQQHFVSLARRRMAAVALAVWSFKEDHGRFPEQLSELTPDFLPSVPLDPFAPADSPIGYVPDDGSVRLYSLGPNGADDDGKRAAMGQGRMDWAQGDITFFLDGRHPDEDLFEEMRRSRQAAQNQPQVAGDESDAEESQSGEQRPE